MRRRGLWIGVVVGVLCMMNCVVSAETLIFDDDFSSGLQTNWQAGTNTALNMGGPQVTASGGVVIWSQGWDFIESKQAFSGNFKVAVDLGRDLGSSQCKDFVVELSGAEGFTGILRLQYGTIALDSINLGQAPARQSKTAGYQGICIADGGPYLQEMATSTPHMGTATLTFLNGKMRFSFQNSTAQNIETPWADVGNIAASRVRIWSTTQSRFVDRVRVYQLSEDASVDCAGLNNDLSLSIPCCDVFGTHYGFKLNFVGGVPGDPNGLYWKLDLNSLHAK